MGPAKSSERLRRQQTDTNMLSDDNKRMILVGLCERERERESERARESERERARAREIERERASERESEGEREIGRERGRKRERHGDGLLKLAKLARDDRSPYTLHPHSNHYTLNR